MKDDLVFLRLTVDACEKIASFISGMSYGDFAADSKTQSAVIMQLQVIGELSKRVPEHIKSTIDIPWKNMSGLRDLVAHNYFNLDLSLIWTTATKSVPDVSAKVRVRLVAAG